MNRTAMLTSILIWLPMAARILLVDQHAGAGGALPFLFVATFVLSHCFGHRRHAYGNGEGGKP